ncbi:diguanylate cyclase [Maribrevibacterium harenarium]|uniref:Diguanylate cyclase n=1 Tax=Maribrevibacterium harenarium TaxID=2589817 RepID=A0A501WRC5_9GAMM|nr:PAS domain-containing protein [Maribrevibacterium harenarium]TPE50920.1 diguanylate cyclase [Maribrevibacterium harenarium]
MNTVFAQAFYLMPTPAFVVDIQSGAITAMNERFELLFRNLGEQPVQQWQQLLNSEDCGELLNIHSAARAKTLEQLSLALHIGTQAVASEVSVRALDKQHLLAYITSTEHMDLSIAENTLLKFALTESSAGLWLWDIRENRISCSPSIATLLGCGIENTPHNSKQWHAMIHKDDVEKFVRTVNEHVEHRQTYYEAEYRIRRANDEYIWVRERGRTFSHDTDGAITKVIGFVENISHQKALEEHLRSQATFDELTGLLNRGAAITHFAKQIGLAKRQYTPLTMAKIDLDARGLLAEMPLERRNNAIHSSARYFYKKIREADILARVAQDKLLLLLPNTSLKDAQKLLEKALKPSEEEQKVLAYGDAHQANFCVGLATFPEDGETVDELAQSANAAVEQGRANGIGISIFH